VGVILLVVTTQGCASFGGVATGARLDRMRASPQWKDDEFVNVEPTTVMQEGSGAALTQWLSSDVMRVPSCPLPMTADVGTSLKSPPKSGLRITWLGHSTTLVELDGLTILTDPMFSERASPTSLVGPRRFHPPPLPLDALPRIDAVVVSHDHYDHLDMASIKALAAKGIPIHVGLGVGVHLEAWGVPAAQIHELEWWQERVIGGVRLVSTPARHFTGRRGFGNNRALWTSWTFVGPTHRVFFSGDTGLTSQFKEVWVPSTSRCWRSANGIPPGARFIWARRARSRRTPCSARSTWCRFTGRPSSWASTRGASRPRRSSSKPRRPGRAW
jgi:hypothetical protein